MFKLSKAALTTFKEHLSSSLYHTLHVFVFISKSLWVQGWFSKIAPNLRVPTKHTAEITSPAFPPKGLEMPAEFAARIWFFFWSSCFKASNTQMLQKRKPGPNRSSPYHTRRNKRSTRAACPLKLWVSAPIPWHWLQRNGFKSRWASLKSGPSARHRSPYCLVSVRRRAGRRKRRKKGWIPPSKRLFM